MDQGVRGIMEISVVKCFQAEPTAEEYVGLPPDPLHDSSSRLVAISIGSFTGGLLYKPLPTQQQPQPGTPHQMHRYREQEQGIDRMKSPESPGKTRTVICCRSVKTSKPRVHRDTAREDVYRARQRLLQLLFRHPIHPPITIKRRWTKKYRTWLWGLAFDHEVLQVLFTEMLHAITEVEQRLGRIEAAILEQAKRGAKASLIRVLQSLRGIALINAVIIAAEIGTFARFCSPMQLMAYLGLVPRERSAGSTVRRGSMDKAGNAYLHRALIEASWSYRHHPLIAYIRQMCIFLTTSL